MVLFRIADICVNDSLFVHTHLDDILLSLSVSPGKWVSECVLKVARICNLSG